MPHVQKTGGGVQSLAQQSLAFGAQTQPFCPQWAPCTGHQLCLVGAPQRCLSWPPRHPPPALSYPDRKAFCAVPRIGVGMHGGAPPTCWPHFLPWIAGPGAPALPLC